MWAPVDVLMVEDEADLGASTLEYLRAFGLSTAYAPSAEDAVGWLADNRPRVVLLDINLPGMNGFELCRRIRASSATPIVFLSARASDDDEILALSVGGDDYLRKPYSLGVLLAKVRRIIERTAGDAGPEGYDDGRLRFDPAADRFWLEGEDLALTAMEHRLLRHLVLNRERVVTKHELFEQVWGDAITGDGTLSVHIRRLRTRIETDPDSPRYLQTVWGRGYSFRGQS
ncbi:MAG: response regulator transcription factor [Micrococcales bacterium]|nr:response regulator transcription factor [Micrococcales bacterium]